MPDPDPSPSITFDLPGLPLPRDSVNVPRLHLLVQQSHVPHAFSVATLIDT